MYSGYGYGSLTELTEFSGHGYGSLTEPTEVPGRYTNVVPVPVPASGYFYRGIPVPRVLCHKRTELTEVPGTGTPGMVLYVPYGTQPFHSRTEVPGRYTNVVPVSESAPGYV